MSRASPRQPFLAAVTIAVLAASLLPAPKAAAAQADPCPAGSTDPLCAAAEFGGSACVAVGVQLRGTLPTTFSSSKAAAPAGPPHDAESLQDFDAGVAGATVVDSTCDASLSPVPNASGSADVATFSVDLTSLGIPLRVSGDGLRAGASSSTAGGTVAARLVSAAIVVAGSTIPIQAATPPNTIVPIGTLGFVGINEQWSSAGDCRRDTNIALRVVLTSPAVEVIVGWVSTNACRLASRIDTQSRPAGSVPPGTVVFDEASVSGPGPSPTGTVGFFLCGPAQVTVNGCEAGGAPVGGPKPVAGGLAASDPVTATQLGRHCWRAAYSGDTIYVGSTHTNGTSECFTVARQQPAISTRSFPVGGNIVPGVAATDTATITGSGPIPTGTVRFFLCRPAEVTANGGDCRAGGTAIGANKTLAGGTATSDATSETRAIGKHCWRAEYSGDSYYLPASHTNATDECFTTIMLGPQIDSFSRPAGGNVPPGTAATDDAILSGAGPTPTGVVAFFLCNPVEVVANGGDCKAGGTKIGTSKVLDATGKASSDPTTATRDEGKHCWRVEYGGDSIYFPANHTNSTSECFTTVRQSSPLTTSSTPTGGNVPPGTAARDQATVTGSGSGPTGTVAFFQCVPAQVVANGGDCKAGGTKVGASKALDATGKAVSDPSSGFVDTRPEGKYCWRAEYSGDFFYAPATHTNASTECFDVRRQPPQVATTSTPTGANVPPGASATDQATVTGAGPTPAGQVTFFLCVPAEVTGAGCPSGGTKVGATKTLNASGMATSDPTAGAVDTRPEGTYCWRAEYSGDSYYLPATHTNATGECFTVRRQQPSIATLSTPTGNNVPPGTPATDQATVTGAGPLPTGTVAFYLCGPAVVAFNGGDCRDGGSKVGATKTLDAAGKAASDSSAGFVDTNMEGTYCWRAQYSGDSYYNSENHTNSAGECFVVRRQGATIQTTSTPSGTGHAPGVAATDRAAVSPIGSGPSPTGEVTFFLCKPGQSTAGGCPAPAGARIGGAKTLAGGSATSDQTQTADTATIGRFCWRAEYSGSSSYLPATHTNGDTECFETVRQTPPIETLSDPTGYFGGEDLDGDGNADLAYTDNATVFPVAPLPTPTGTVRFILCRPNEVTPAGCPAPNGGGGEEIPLDESGRTPPDGHWTVIVNNPPPEEPATYCWRAEYSGDANYLPATHTNATTECFTWVGPARLSTNSGPGGAVGVHPGMTVTDAVEARGLGPIPTGSVRFYLCGPNELTSTGCPFGAGIQVGGTKALAQDGTQHSLAYSDRYTTPAGGPYGRYCWRVQYLGDGVYGPVHHTDTTHECFTLLAPPSVSTTSNPNGPGSVHEGTTVRDVATVTGVAGYPAPAGSVYFLVCGPLTSASGCPSGGTVIGGAKPLTSGTATSDPFTAPASWVGKWGCWRAEYTGDAVYHDKTHTNTTTECFQVFQFF